jgi:hypothetical protein
MKPRVSRAQVRMRIFCFIKELWTKNFSEARGRFDFWKGWSMITNMKAGLLGLALAGFLFSNLPVPIQAGVIKSCCCAETDQPCHSPMVPSPCSACPAPSGATAALPLVAVELSLPTSTFRGSDAIRFSASARTDRPLLTPPRIVS